MQSHKKFIYESFAEKKVVLEKKLPIEPRTK